MPAEFNPQKEFRFNPPAAPAVVSELGLASATEVKIQPHPEPWLDPKSFSQVQEFQVLYTTEDNKEWKVAKNTRVIYSDGYWIASHNGFMYTEVLPGKGSFVGAIDLARVQANLTQELFETEEGNKVFLPHWSLVNYSGIPRPSAGTVVAGVISAAHRVLRGNRNGLLLNQAFCQTEEMLFSTKKPDVSGVRSIQNFIRLGSNMDAIFINPLEHDQDPAAALAYLKQKYSQSLSKR